MAQDLGRVVVIGGEEFVITGTVPRLPWHAHT
jgi:hypothetical protein